MTCSHKPFKSSSTKRNRSSDNLQRAISILRNFCEGFDFAQPDTTDGQSDTTDARPDTTVAGDSMPVTLSGLEGQSIIPPDY